MVLRSLSFVCSLNGGESGVAEVKVIVDKMKQVTRIFITSVMVYSCSEV